MGKTGLLAGLDLPSAGGGTETGVQSPYQGNYLSQRKTFKAESETAGLGKPPRDENQTVLAAAVHTLDRDASPLESAAAGS